MFLILEFWLIYQLHLPLLPVSHNHLEKNSIRRRRKKKEEEEEREREREREERGEICKEILY